MTVSRPARSSLVDLQPSQDVEPGEMKVLSDQERQRLLFDFNATHSPFTPACIHQLFAQQVARTPDAIALAFQDSQLTYAQLHLRSNLLAHRLQSLGVGPDVRVGLSLSRSVELVVAMLAILKAGGTYVPLDPAYPRDRLAFMLRDSGAPVLLTQRHLAHLLPHDGLSVLFLDSDSDSGESHEPSSSCDPDNIAYAIYTSGSTGKPKGVLVPHRSVANFFFAMDSRVLPPHGGPGVLAGRHQRLLRHLRARELLWTLCRGFEVVLRSDTLDSGWLSLQLQATAPPTSSAPPPWPAPFSWTPGPPRLSATCASLVGGEALPPSLARQLLERVPSLLNVYGPTETTIWSTAHPVQLTHGPIALGPPVANTQLSSSTPP